MSYDYDMAGRRTQIVDQDGFTTNYAYDSAGRLDRLTDGQGTVIVEYTYDVTGRLTRTDKGDGSHTSYQYDAAGQLLHLINEGADGTTLSRFDYTYDSLGRRTAMETVYGTWTYAYAANGQLTHAVLVSIDPEIPSRDITYEYDPAGNRVAVTEDGTTTYYRTNELNEYTQIGDTTYQYDADGNLVAAVSGDEITTYVYNDENQLTQVVSPDGLWDYEYDVLGNRSAVSVDGYRTEYLIDPTGLGNVMAAYAAASGYTSSFIHGLGLVGWDSDDQSYYYHFDAIGSTANITDANGVGVNQYAYLPFGGEVLYDETIANDFQFVGQWGVMNEGNEVEFMRARYYDAEMGRFMQPDPIGLAGGTPNLFSYTGNSPAGSTDPSGTFSVNDFFSWLDVGVGIANFLLPKIPGLQDFSLDQGGEVAQVVECTLDMTEHWTPPEGPIGIPYSKLPYEGFDDLGGFPNRSPTPWGLPIGIPYPLNPFPKGPLPGGPFSIPLPLLHLCLKFPFLCSGPVGIPNTPSVTPEDKFGPIGYDDPETLPDQQQRFINGDDLLSYRVDFWNAPTAEVPTQDVVIVDPLDANLDWSTLSFTRFGFLDWDIDWQGGQHIDTQVDLRPQMNLLVNVNASFDPGTGEMSWWFQAVDPLTGDYPEDPMAGFLPPFNEQTQYELGWIEYTVRPKSGLVTGEIISNQAFVQFDLIGPFNPAPKPDPWLNTIDAAAPISNVAQLPESLDELIFLVEWAGQDETNGSGLASFDVYVSDDGGSFRIWQRNTEDTSALYSGEPGHTYAFFSIARDHVGNTEPVPSTPDTKTTMEFVQLSDLDGDGYVGSGDLDIVRAHWGQSVTAGDLTMGDPSGDGLVGSADLDIVRANWGVGTPTAATTESDTRDSSPTSTTPTLIGPRRAPASDAAFSSWGNSNNKSGLSLSLSEADLASLAEAAWLREMEGLQSKGKRKGVERGNLSEMVLLGE